MGALRGTEVIILTMITIMLLQKASSKSYPYYIIQIPQAQISLEAGSYTSYMFHFFLPLLTILTALSISFGLFPPL